MDSRMLIHLRTYHILGMVYYAYFQNFFFCTTVQIGIFIISLQRKWTAPLSDRLRKHTLHGLPSERWAESGPAVGGSSALRSGSAPFSVGCVARLGPRPKGIPVLGSRSKVSGNQNGWLSLVLKASVFLPSTYCHCFSDAISAWKDNAASLLHWGRIPWFWLHQEFNGDQARMPISSPHFLTQGVCFPYLFF